MPYEIKNNGKMFQVVTKDTGKVHGNFRSVDQAKSQLQALYANADPKDEK